ncbi:hypothetical protein Bbelb_073420 [Branchiostoma belcheri]|nr:hypothetical protein Bbelb_073420 [Branchiostoma belcheri]
MEVPCLGEPHPTHVKEPTALIEKSRGPSLCEWFKPYSLVSGLTSLKRGSIPQDLQRMALASGAKSVINISFPEENFVPAYLNTIKTNDVWGDRTGNSTELQSSIIHSCRLPLHSPMTAGNHRALRTNIDVTCTWGRASSPFADNQAGPGFRTEAVLTTHGCPTFAHVFARRQHAEARTAGCDRSFMDEIPHTYQEACTVSSPGMSAKRTGLKSE